MNQLQKLPGNEEAYKTFAAWIGGGRLPHAILLEGVKGCGKTILATQLAQAVLCDGTGKPCGECRHCIKIEKGVHPDFISAEGEGRARSFHIDTVREIKAKAQMFPNEAQRKVFFLKNVQDMTVQAQNALLKLLEEPPLSAIFIMTCENKSSLLETVRSRVSAVTVTGARDSKEADDTGESGEAGILWKSVAGGDKTAALALLAGYDRDRAGFEALLRSVRRIVEKLALSNPEQKEARISSLRLLAIVDIIDEIISSSAGNGNVPLLGSVFFARVIDVIK